MKRRIFSALLVLLLICTPLLCLTGCQSDPGNDVVFKVTASGDISFVVGDAQSKIGEKVAIELNYYLQKWNPETSKYGYVVYSESEPSGYTFAAEKSYFYTSNTRTLSQALADGMTISGFNTLTATKGEERTLKLSFSGITHEFKYTVSASGTSGGASDGTAGGQTQR